MTREELTRALKKAGVSDERIALALQELDALRASTPEERRESVEQAWLLNQMFILSGLEALSAQSRSTFNEWGVRMFTFEDGRCALCRGQSIVLQKQEDRREFLLCESCFLYARGYGGGWLGGTGHRELAYQLRLDRSAWSRVNAKRWARMRLP